MRKILHVLTNILAAVLISVGIAWAAGAATLVGQVNGGVTEKLSPDGKFKVSLDPVPVKPDAAPLKAELKMLRGIYGDYKFQAGAASGGTFNILQYDAFARPHRGGADFSVLYDDGVAAPRTDYDWIQIAYPTNWGSHDSEPFVDSLVFASPFYSNYDPSRLATNRTPTDQIGPAIWKDGTNYPQQNIQNPAGGGKVPAGDLLLADEPYCSYTCLKDDIASSIIFDTFLTVFTAPEFNKRGRLIKKGSVTIEDGFTWGVMIEAVVCEKAPLRGDTSCHRPIPEPPALALLVPALVLLGWVTRSGRSGSLPRGHAGV